MEENKIDKKSIEQKPSKTALFAALRRTLANKEFENGKFGPDDLAKCFLPPHFRFFLGFKKMRTNIKNKLDRFLPGGREYLMARTIYFDRLFVDALTNKISQIVLLGAGYDSRAYRFTNLNEGTRIFELDIAPTQDRKKKCLRKARIAVPEQVTFVPINFNRESIKDVLKKAGYHSDQKTLFMWEGVSYYLEEESVNTTLELVSKSSLNESAIAFDYTIPVSEENINNYYGVKEFTQAMKAHHANEELMFSINEGQIESFLEKRGLKMIEHLNNDEIEKTLLFNENESLMGHIIGHFRFVLATSKKQQVNENPDSGLT